jgi:CheY-like chemotaxis protein
LNSFLSASIENCFPKVNHASVGSCTTSKGVVLCIDDNQDILECEKSFLETFGYTVLTAPSGDNGLELASIHSVDVVIVDYHMPEINGQEFAVEMSRLRPRAPIILHSAALNIPEQTLKLVDAFITKDCWASQLLPIIAQLHKRGSLPPLPYDS